MGATLYLTVKQATALWVVEQNGPASVSDVADHMLVSDGVARGVLNRLEWRGLVGRTYTGHGRHSVFAFVITAKGSVLLADLDTDSL
jgi:DNA-binding MarR family transcriptional regulator